MGERGSVTIRGRGVVEVEVEVESLQILDLHSLPREWLLNGASTVFQTVKLITWVLVDGIKVHRCLFF